MQKREAEEEERMRKVLKMKEEDDLRKNIINDKDEVRAQIFSHKVSLCRLSFKTEKLTENVCNLWCIQRVRHLKIYLMFFLER